MYSSEDAEAVEASIDVLPIVVRALGIGATRYLKALIPQLTHPLHPTPYKKPRVTLQLASLRALETVIQECHPRIENWKGTIVEGVAKCWAVLWDDEKKTDENSDELRRGLRAVCARLWELAPSVTEEYVGLLKLDSTIFDNLVGDFVNPQTEELAAIGTS